MLYLFSSILCFKILERMISGCYEPGGACILQAEALGFMLVNYLVLACGMAQTGGVGTFNVMVSPSPSVIGVYYYYENDDGTAPEVRIT